MSAGTRILLRRLAPVAFLATGACVATRNDIRILQNDLAVMRSESMYADSVRRRQLDSVIANLGRTQDSLRAMSARVLRFQGDVKEDMYNLGQQLVQVQELTGQSQRRLQELRASLEQQRQEAAAVQQQAVGASTPGPIPAAGQPTTPGTTPSSGASPAPPTGATTTPADPTPGPNQLFQLALDQMRRGSTGAARVALQDLLRQYPTSDVAPDAQFYIGQSFEEEGNNAAADSAYNAVVTRWPQSPRAPTALYKRATVLQRLNRVQAARAALNDVIKRYPRAEEADLARERLKTLR